MNTCSPVINNSAFPCFCWLRRRSPPPRALGAAHFALLVGLYDRATLEKKTVMLVTLQQLFLRARRAYAREVVLR